MYRKTFECLCKRTLSPIHIIFNTVNSISDINSMHIFKDIWRIFTKVEPCADGRTDRQNYQMHVKNHVTQLKIHFQSFSSIAHSISEIFCEVLYTKNAFVYLNDICIFHYIKCNLNTFNYGLKFLSLTISIWFKKLN